MFNVPTMFVVSRDFRAVGTRFSDVRSSPNHDNVDFLPVEQVDFECTQHNMPQGTILIMGAQRNFSMTQNP